MSARGKANLVILLSISLILVNQIQAQEYEVQSPGEFIQTTSFKANNTIEYPNSTILDSHNRQFSVIESLFGLVAKAVVYGGASFARFNNRLLCPLLTYETEIENEDQPILFVFNNHLNRGHTFRIYADDDITPSMVKEARFDSEQMTVIFVHGWLGGIHNEIWLSEAKNVALNGFNQLRADWSLGSNSNGNTTFRPNVIIVEWSEFAHGLLYTATKNSFKVSQRLAHLLEQLTNVGGLRPELMHCLGHSIGTHICGQAARKAFPAQRRPASSPGRRLGRITGLDPGGFCYEIGIKNETTYLGLKPSDALLVDAYYSNRSPFGNKYLVAQYNVYLNNGFLQQPCSVWLNPNIAIEYFRAAVRFVIGNVGNNDILTCDHYFATRFAYQIPPVACSYVAYACDSYRNFLRGRCGLCNSPSQCYSMDFEYQKPNSSVAHALENINKHSSYFNDFYGKDDVLQASQPLGGVPYPMRRVYYLQISNEEPYCSIIFRVRVHLDTQVVDIRSFRNDWLKLRFYGSGDKVVRVKDASNGKSSDTISLHGPWNQNERLDQVSELDRRTLTALFELTLNEFHDGQLLEAPIKDVSVVYDNNLIYQQDPSANPIDYIQLDYLSSTNQRIRSQNSRLFQRKQFKVLYKHLDVSARTN